MEYKKKIVIWIFMLFAIAFIILGIIGIKSKNELSIKENEQNIKEENNDKIAYSIIEYSHMDDFIATAFNHITEINSNLIDVTSKKTYVNLFLQNDEVEKYIVNLNISPLGKLIYIKYTDFIKYSKLIFDTEPQYNYQEITLAFKNLNKNENNEYDILDEDIERCDFENNAEICYVLVTSGEVELNSQTEFLNLTLNNNIITGDVIKYYDRTNKNIYIDGTFEFEFEYKNDKYIPKSFKITKINPQ